jgi:hypothetical protein
MYSYGYYFEEKCRIYKLIILHLCAQEIDSNNSLTNKQ